MGTLLNILANTVGQILGGGSGSGASFEQLQILAQRVTQVVTALAQAVASNEFQEYGAVKWSATDAKQIGHDFEQIEGDWESNFNRLLDTILPQSFKHLVGYVWSTGITPLNVAMRQAQADVVTLKGRVNTLYTWRSVYVDPLLEGYQQFIAWWDGNFSAPALTLIDWLKRPDDFGVWAAPPVVGPLVAYLADGAHEQTRDNLTRIMVSAWTEVPNDVYDLMLQWLLTDGS